MRVKTVAELIAELYRCVREGSAKFDTPVRTADDRPVYVVCATIAVVVTDEPGYPNEPDPRD